MAREFLRITPESTWGVYNTGGTHTVITLDQNNAFTMRAKPVLWTIRTAAGGNVRQQRGSAKTAIAGGLNTLVYGSQAPVFVTWIMATGSPLNVTSCTVDHCYVAADSGTSQVYNRYLGTLVGSAKFTASETDQLMRLNLELVAKQKVQITSTDFPEPAFSAYASDAPYVLEHAGGAYKWCNSGGSLVSKPGFENFDCTIKHNLDTRFFENQYLTAYQYGGRDVDFMSKFMNAYLVDRANYEALQTQKVTITFSNGTGEILQSDITIGAGGTLYTSPKAVLTGTGTGAVLEAVQVGGIITEINVLAPGYGYTGTPTITVTDGGSGSGATATVALSTNHTMIFNFENNVFYDAVDDDLSMDKVFTQGLTMNSLLDSVAGTDFALTAT